MARQDILLLLAGSDKRSIGRADEVARIVEKQPKLFSQLIRGMWSEQAVVRMRAADATEKVTRARPGLLSTYKRELLGLLAEATDKEIRWHLAVIVPRLPMSAKERQRAASFLEVYLEDPSSIVKTFALEGLADLSTADRDLRTRVRELLHASMRNGTPAMKARSRKLLSRLEHG